MAKQDLTPCFSLVAPTPVQDAHFGNAAAMDGEWLLVRAVDEVFWYRRDGPSGVQLHSSTASTGPIELFFLRGRSVEVQGTISAVTDDDAVSIYRYGQTMPDTWSLVRTVVDEFDDFGVFGNSVSLSGDTLAVGSPSDGSGVDGGGAVYVFERNEGGVDNWGRTLFRPSASITRFGRLVDVDGDLLAVSGDNVNNFVQIFERDLGGAGAWGEGAQITGTSSRILSMALRGDRLAVSSLGNNGRGVVVIHRRDLGGPGAWGIEHYFVASDRDWNDGLGYELAWLDDETIAASTRTPVTFQVGIDHQSVYVFRIGGPQIDTEKALLLPRQFDPVPEKSASLGHALAGVPDLLFATAPETGSALAGPPPARPVDSGRIHVFSVPGTEIFADGFEGAIAP